MSASDHLSAVFPVLANPDVEVLATRLDVDDTAEAELIPLLSVEELGRADRFHFKHHRRHYIVARARLRQLLGIRLQVPPATVEISVGRHGKPALGGGHETQKLSFNLSHSGQLAVYAFSHSQQVGVDVEAFRHIPEIDGLAERYFSTAEVAALRATPSDQRQLAFLACWTRKEAFVKAVGEGLNYPLKSFDVSVSPHAPAAILRVGTLNGKEAGWRMTAFQPASDHIGAVVY